MPAVQPVPKNICTPQNIFGPMQQTLFCGCSILDFQATAGWNNDGITTVTVNVAQDPCTSTTSKKYYNKNLNVVYTNNPDPGFTEPTIGAPAYFRLGDFEFCGLVQAWKQKNDTNGMPTYEVRLTAPNEILNGMQLIINDYAGYVTYTDVNTGQVMPVYNIFNVFGFMEMYTSYGYTCPWNEIAGGGFGSPAGKFGGALANDNGMSWNMIKIGASLLTSSFPPMSVNQQAYGFSPHGRIVFRGANPNNDGYGIIEHDFWDSSIPGQFPNHDGYLSYYFIDLSEVPSAPDYWRLGGTNITMMEAISQVCQDAGRDFYIELIPAKYMGTVWKFIKVRTVSRSSQQSLGYIASFIEDYDISAMSTSVGQELRSEYTTSFLVGGNRRSIYQSINGNPDSFIGPYFGIDINKNLNPYWVNAYGDYEFELDITRLNAQLHTPLSVNTVTVDESELRCAIDSYDVWLTWADVTETDLGTAIRTDYNKGDHLITSDVLGRILEAAPDKMLPSQWINWATFHAKAGAEKNDVDRIYEFLATFARENYGKKFLVKLPYTCTYIDPESYNVRITDQPSPDGAWTEYTDILGLPHPTAYTDFFSTNEKGLIGPIVNFSSASEADNVEISPDYFGIYNSQLYVRGEVEEAVFYENYSTFYSPYVLVTLPNPVFDRETSEDFSPSCNFVMELINRKNYTITKTQLENCFKKVGSSHLLFGIYRKALVPNAVAVPLLSNVSTYGPWVLRGPAGSVKCERDEGLVPWEYGNETLLNVAGLGKVQEAVTQMQVSEMGDITVPGYPDIPLGAELGAVAGGKFGGGQHLIESRDVFNGSFGGSSYYYTDLNVNDGIYGPNITNITVSVGQQGATTTYQMKTFTPTFGRFSKSHIERFRELTAQRSKFLKFQRGNSLTLGRIALARKFSKGLDRTSPRGETNAAPKTSTSDLIVGQIHDWDTDSKLSSIGILPIKEMSVELQSFGEKAFMSLDGLLRPVSRAGDGGLPRYASKAGTQCGPRKHQTDYVQPPVNGYTPLNISTSYLDPVATTSDTKHGTSDGHDIQALGHNTDMANIGSINCHIDELASGYVEPTDYRFLALRGPLVIHGWGYDLNGKPIPNAADVELAASSGVFVTGALEDSFLTDWMRKSHTWPVAPVDLRYDRKRGVWTVPGPARMILAMADGNISSEGEGECTPINLGNISDSTGTIITDPKISVTNPSGYNTLHSGNVFTAYYDTYDCTYYPVANPLCKREEDLDTNIKCRVVKTIECSQDTLTVVYSYLEFAECGLFVGCSDIGYTSGEQPSAV